MRDNGVHSLIDTENENELSGIVNDIQEYSKSIDNTETWCNEVFTKLKTTFPSKLFEIVYVMSDTLEIPEDKMFTKLDEDNRNLLKNYAINKYNTNYYEKKEKLKNDAKLRRKGRFSEIHDKIEDLFE